MSEVTPQGLAAINRADNLAKDIISFLRKQGVETETATVFYCTLLGVLSGNIAGHIGKDALLVILDLLKDQIPQLIDADKGARVI